DNIPSGPPSPIPSSSLIPSSPSPIPSSPSPIPSSPSPTSSELPQEFTYMKNEYEIAAWVSDHKRILDLAMSIRKAKRQRIDTDSEDDVGKTIGNNRVSTLII